EDSGTTVHPKFVAFGDSLTTGGSVATCQPDRGLSPWGCTSLPPAATPYPEWLAMALDYRYSSDPDAYHQAAPGFVPFDLHRAGIWGYTAQEAATAAASGHNAEGDWMPQLAAIEQATELVVGSLGINDLRFS